MLLLWSAAAVVAVAAAASMSRGFASSGIRSSEQPVSSRTATYRMSRTGSTAMQVIGPDVRAKQVTTAHNTKGAFRNRRQEKRVKQNSERAISSGKTQNERFVGDQNIFLFSRARRVTAFVGDQSHGTERARHNRPLDCLQVT